MGGRLRLTFSRVIRKKSTEEFSCIPYVVTLLNCLLYAWYGLPVVREERENFPVFMINRLEVVLEFSFIVIYIWFASTKNKMKLVTALMGVVVMFSMIAVISTFMLRDHRHRMTFLGSIGLAPSVEIHGSPLVAVKQVVMTKSVEFMPFYLSLFSFLASSLGMAHGPLGHDLILASPNLAGSPQEKRSRRRRTD